VSENHRFLVDQHGRPFRIQGDSAQSLIANLTFAEADTYLTDRRSKASTPSTSIFWNINSLSMLQKIAWRFPIHCGGQFRHSECGLFRFADSIIDLAASKGNARRLAAMYLGYGGGVEGWWSTLTNAANTQTVCYTFGLYVGNRYKIAPTFYG